MLYLLHYTDRRNGFDIFSVLLNIKTMTGNNGEREDPASPPTSAWCTSTSVGNTVFEFPWNIADYQRKKESVKRDDSIQSSTFTVQVYFHFILT